MVAMMRNEPHWMLTDADAKAYGAALHNAMRHFPIGATQKALDLGALMMMAFTMESPRVHKSWSMARDRKQRPTGQEAQGGGATVYRLHPNNPQQPPPAPPAGPAPAQQPSGGGVEGFTGEGDPTLGGTMGPH